MVRRCRGQHLVEQFLVQLAMELVLVPKDGILQGCRGCDDRRGAVQGGKGGQIVVGPALALLACTLMSGHSTDTIHLVAGGTARKSRMQWRSVGQVEPNIRVYLSQVLAKLGERLECMCLAFTRCKRTDRQRVSQNRGSGKHGFLTVHRPQVAELVSRTMTLGAFPSPHSAAVSLTGRGMWWVRDTVAGQDRASIIRGHTPIWVASMASDASIAAFTSQLLSISEPPSIVGCRCMMCRGVIRTSTTSRTVRGTCNADTRSRVWLFRVRLCEIRFNQQF
jgi:hypothetical protein